MMKEIKVIKEGRIYIVQIADETVENMRGLAIRVFHNNENVLKHWLDFSKHPTNEIEQNKIKFTEIFNEDTASRWVDIYLEMAVPPKNNGA